jgi:polyribonucleotide nucleotidyltransferase
VNEEISEAEMLEAIKFAHEHIKIKFLQGGSCFGKKKFVPTKEKEDEAIYAKVSIL